MNVTFDFLFLIGAAVSVVGILEYLKGFFPVSTPSWVWRAALAPVAFLVALAADGGWYQIATNALSLVALTQISYPVLIQLPSALIEAFRKKLG
jgi:hypothetical protein